VESTSKVAVLALCCKPIAGPGLTPPKRSYASRTRRLDIPARLSYFLLANGELREGLGLALSVALYDPAAGKRLHVLLEEGFWVGFSGRGERDVVAYFAESIARGRRVARLSEGLFEAVQRYAHQGYSVAVLREGGGPFSKVEELLRRGSRVLLVVGTDCDPPPWLESRIRGAFSVSVGPESYLALHAILFALYNAYLAVKCGRSLLR